jgi:hypothetical protein
MKKILLISLIMLLSVSVAFSQFGIKGGINLGTIGGADKSQGGIDPTNRLGLVGGISYRIGLIAGLSLQPEVMYIQKGAVYEGSQNQGSYSITGKSTLKGDYLDIPLLLKFNLPIPQFSPYIEGGASYGILLSAKQKSEVTSNVPGYTSSSDEVDIKDQITKGDLSIIVGVGFDITILEIDARFIFGMNRLGKDNPDTPTVDENAAKAYNRGIIITAGIRL